MSWAEASRVHRATEPSASGLQQLGRVLEEDVRVVRQLHGGVATCTHELATPTRRLVLKRYQADDGTAASEWERLRVASALPVPTPEPIAVDLAGEWFGTSALVMTWVPGAVTYPAPVDALARTLAAIHDAPIPNPPPAALQRPPYYDTWEPEVEYPDGLLDAMYELRERSKSLPKVVSHADYHPGNVLVDDGEISGVIDWASLRLAPRGFDVGLMRGDLTVIPGADAADEFLECYERAAGTRVEDLAWFDAFAAARILDHGAGWVDAWTDVGIDVTVGQIERAALDLAASALARIAAT
jgi:aminoglycoside phosphotransferase (APT) family kinase protein